MRRRFRLLALLLLACFAWSSTSCETDDAPRGPMDDTSALPWNRPLPGERSGPLGAMPFQSR